jgi:hypothetical protein
MPKFKLAPNFLCEIKLVNSKDYVEKKKFFF